MSGHFVGVFKRIPGILLQNREFRREFREVSGGFQRNFKAFIEDSEGNNFISVDFRRFQGIKGKFKGFMTRHRHLRGFWGFQGKTEEVSGRFKRVFKRVSRSFEGFQGVPR